MWFIYILQCKNKSLYTGMTNNLEKRFKMHQQGKAAAYTRAFGVKRVAYSEVCKSKSHALKREAEIKRWSREKKLNWIKNNS